MAIEYNPNIAIPGLLANWDFDNIKSFVPTQNLFLYSQDFTNANWTKNLAAITGNTVLAPDGTLTGQTLTEDTNTGQHLITQSPVTVAVGNVFTLSVYAKAGTRTSISLTSYGEGYSVFNLSNGTITQTGGNTCTITDAGNGWYRCSATITKTNATANNFYVIMWNGSQSYLGTGANQYIWGAQLELNSTMNDYVATTSAAAVRSTNIVDMIGGYNMSNSYGNNAYYINTTSSFMQFTRTTSAPKYGGGATVGTSGNLTAANFLYNDHTWEIWFRIDNIQPGYASYGNDVEEQYSGLANYQGYHAGFQYTASGMYYYIWNGLALPTCASWTVGTSGAQINQGTWYQIVVTRLGNVFTPYINGAPLGTGSTSVTSVTGIGTTNNLWIGKVTNQAAGAGDYIYYSFSSVANMKMYNRALAPSEIAQNFQALRGRFGI